MGTLWCGTPCSPPSWPLPRMGILPCSLHSSFSDVNHYHLLTRPPEHCPAPVLHPSVGTLPSSPKIPLHILPSWTRACNLCSPLGMVLPCKLSLHDIDSARTTCQLWPAVGSLLHQFPSCPTSANQCPQSPASLSEHLSDWRKPQKHIHSRLKFWITYYLQYFTAYWI